MPSIFVFSAITAIYFLIVVLGACYLGFFDPRGIPIDPNEWGDVLAGIFSPVAFLWLIFSSLSQKYELSLQRNELELQRQEVKNANRLRAKDFSSRTTADYEPVFLVEYIDFPKANSPEGAKAVVGLKNLGAGVLDVVFEGVLDISNGDALYHHRDGGEVYYLPSGLGVELHHSSSYELVITYTRKDGVSKRNSYILSADRNSMKLNSSEELELDDEEASEEANKTNGVRFTS